jgi:hypothetical protein
MTKAGDVAKRNRDLDKKWFANPSKWPRHPVLPLKRYKEQAVPPELGFVLAQDVTKVCLGNMFNTDIKNLGSIIYASTDELLNDGWVVD